MDKQCECTIKLVTLMHEGRRYCRCGYPIATAYWVHETAIPVIVFISFIAITSAVMLIFNA